jgi:hypothetical protein
MFLVQPALSAGTAGHPAASGFTRQGDAVRWQPPPRPRFPPSLVGAPRKRPFWWSGMERRVIGSPTAGLTLPDSLGWPLDPVVSVVVRSLLQLTELCRRPYRAYKTTAEVLQCRPLGHLRGGPAATVDVPGKTDHALQPQPRKLMTSIARRCRSHLVSNKPLTTQHGAATSNDHQGATS